MTGPLLAAALSLLGATSLPGRFAVLVGANQASPGRQPLQFAHRDAEEMADVLERTAEFPRAQVQVLLDPEPDAVLRALDSALSSASRAPEGSLVVFYYSGHSDMEALFPGGRRLPLSKLRERLESPSATVRVGIIDACRGGGWTQVKGVAREAPLQIHRPLELTSEGSALLSSSSGVESAHESELLSGSFFTHHLVAGLRGAADDNGDGEVTLGEAFLYAKERTVRDSSLQAEAPQHPSFRINLHGRSDLAISRIAASDTVMEVRQSEGPLEVIQLTTGLVMLELPRGKRALRLSVPPGRYLVRERGPGGIRGEEIAVEEDRVVVVDEAKLELVGSPLLTVKGGESRPGQGTWFSLVALTGTNANDALRLQIYPYSGEKLRVAVEGFLDRRRLSLRGGTVPGAFLFPEEGRRVSGAGGGLRLEWAPLAAASDGLLLAPGIDLHRTSIDVLGVDTTLDPGSPAAAFVTPRPVTLLGADLDVIWIHRLYPHLATEIGVKAGYFRPVGREPGSGVRAGATFDLIAGLRF